MYRTSISSCLIKGNEETEEKKTFHDTPGKDWSIVASCKQFSKGFFLLLVLVPHDGAHILLPWEYSK